MTKRKTRKLKIEFGKFGFIMIAVFAVLLTVDLVLKYCEEAFGWNFTVIPHLITAESGNHNYGAAFSFLADTEWGRIFFIVLTFVMLAVLICAFILLPERFAALKLALVMIISGALGNLIDRLAFGYVRDFVWVNIFGNWACCNFADFWIVFGVIIAVIDVLFFNEWAFFPLTKKAKARVAAAEKRRKENATAAEQTEIDSRETEEERSDGTQDGEDGGGDRDGD